MSLSPSTNSKQRSGDAPCSSRVDIWIMSLWWGLAAGLGEGLALRSTHTWIWRDLLWSAVIFEPLLFLLPAVVVFVARRGRRLDSGVGLRLTFVFCWLALFDWVRVGYAALDVRYAVLSTVAAASLVGFV